MEVLSYLTDQAASGYSCRPWDHPSSGNSGTEVVYPFHPRKGLVLEEVGQGKPRSQMPSMISWLIPPTSL